MSTSIDMSQLETEPKRYASIEHRPKFATSENSYLIYLEKCCLFDPVAEALRDRLTVPLDESLKVPPHVLTDEALGDRSSKKGLIRIVDILEDNEIQVTRELTEGELADFETGQFLEALRMCKPNVHTRLLLVELSRENYMPHREPKFMELAIAELIGNEFDLKPAVLWRAIVDDSFGSDGTNVPVSAYKSGPVHRMPGFGTYGELFRVQWLGRRLIGTCHAFIGRPFILLRAKHVTNVIALVFVKSGNLTHYDFRSYFGSSSPSTMTEHEQSIKDLELQLQDPGLVQVRRMDWYTRQLVVGDWRAKVSKKDVGRAFWLEPMIGLNVALWEHELYDPTQNFLKAMPTNRGGKRQGGYLGDKSGDDLSFHLYRVGDLFETSKSTVKDHEQLQVEVTNLDFDDVSQVCRDQKLILEQISDVRTRVEVALNTHVSMRSIEMSTESILESKRTKLCKANHPCDLPPADTLQ